VHVRQRKTAKEVRETLLTASEDRRVNNRRRLLGKLASLRLPQFSSIQAVVTAIMSSCRKPRDLGTAVEDQMLLGSTKAYAPLRTAIANPNITLTTEYVKPKRLQMDVQTAVSKFADFRTLNKKSCQYYHCHSFFFIM
jgi:hypothetical protein